MYLANIYNIYNPYIIPFYERGYKCLNASCILIEYLIYSAANLFKLSEFGVNLAQH